ncbi:hypothetical protein A2276_05595 [candidate division WOR-1 bacterium RIFOXYA12_FULL_43_27]|uniref:Uncharacterized protein n=1 Tax=candidate division WOR-1 bacterium RIFOXYC2_FULL_46_14 TaxID=1802587 RepID=A0A1F4U3H7_UNCSA|nr:MAG: hypothetical protein A2276_05595 [candidate division WOR-1 bacterium RIFOXYA12_FULL_43_27]OGC20139.1 MAG: hypothetical protein A2292_03600 [candidate division WOR-1 bacterium RIFOXYB2_FULL_46_45]OGC32124.1 MAG: hypothetical protein A2232_07850 [candidate division WOR-1 bacterium RIFOXYA2_FULL_46_56]OGC39525.1 MAG: hypothetical protein A2438_08215 [candidate division WOR-1 bacterium RIFOXYC2_FULL_46_14]
MISGIGNTGLSIDYVRFTMTSNVIKNSIKTAEDCRKILSEALFGKDDKSNEKEQVAEKLKLIEKLLKNLRPGDVQTIMTIKSLLNEVFGDCLDLNLSIKPKIDQMIKDMYKLLPNQNPIW